MAEFKFGIYQVFRDYTTLQQVYEKLFAGPYKEWWEIKKGAGETVQKTQFAEEFIDYFKDTNSSDLEEAYFEKMLDLRYENECLKRQNVELKAKNRTLKAKLEKAYDFMRQFSINGMNMLEHFLQSIGEWVQQKEGGRSR